MLTKDEMLEKGCCAKIAYCSECPFDRLKDMVFSECYAKNIEQYKLAKLASKTYVPDNAKILGLDVIEDRSIPKDTIFFVNNNPDKELKLKKKEFTLLDLAKAIEDKLRIRHTAWRESSAYITASNDRLHWIDENCVKLHPDFRTISNWEFYKEPKKTVKKTYYQADILDKFGKFIYKSRFFESRDMVSIGKNEVVVDWKEKEFEIPEEDNGQT